MPTIVVTLVVAVGSVLLVVCGFAWAARREEVAEVARLGRLELRSIEALTPGELGAVRGTVVESPDVDADPLTDERVVWWEARVLRRDRGRELLSKRHGEALRLDDGTGAVRVMLEGAEIAVALEEIEASERVPSERTAALLADAAIEVPDRDVDARYVVEHRRVAVGDELTLIGIPRESQDGLRFTSRGPLYLTPGSLEALQARQREDLRAMDTMLKLGAGLGVALIAVGIALVLALG